MQQAMKQLAYCLFQSYSYYAISCADSLFYFTNIEIMTPVRKGRTYGACKLLLGVGSIFKQ